MNYLDSLNKHQKEAVTFEGGPLLLLAGAGSGKTRVITTRIAYAIEQLGFSPWSILAVTFTNKAAGEMRERVESLVPEAEGVMIKTFHSFGAWLLRRNAEFLGMKSSFSIYDDDDVRSLLKSLNPGSTASEIRHYAYCISRAKDECLTPDDDLSHLNPDPDFNEVYDSYEKKLRSIGNADFGDLISLPARLLKQYGEIQNRLNSRFKMILVDEYQDSNKAQFELLKLLAGPDTWVCVVGDDDQSIYKFRGAEVKNILDFEQYFPGTRVIKLEENFRSTGYILSIASSVVSHNSKRLGKTLWTSKGNGLKGTIKYLKSDDEEVKYCAELLRDGNYKETAILYRTNAQSRAFESHFIRNNIPYKIVGTLRFYEREEVKDALALLAFIANSRDEIAFRRMINKPTRGIGKVTMEKLIFNAVEGDLLEGLKNNPPVKGKALKGVKEFVALIENALATDFERNFGAFVRKVIDDAGLVEYHANKDKNTGAGKVENLEELVNAASKYEGPNALTDFLEAIELDQSSVDTDEEEDENRVTLITMHNTKGLEYDRVIITGMEMGLFPRMGELEDTEELEEERRLFYVSITRARKELYFTSCSLRRIHGRLNESMPSLFLKEVPKEYIHAASEPIPSSSGFKRGDGVYHDDYGSGYIIKSWNNGKHDIVLVKFETGQVAQFLPEFAALEKISL